MGIIDKNILKNLIQYSRVIIKIMKEKWFEVLQHLQKDIIMIIINGIMVLYFLKIGKITF